MQGSWGRHDTAIWSPTTATLNALLKNNVEVRAFCTRCKNIFPVDLTDLAQLCGPGFSLWDKRWSCRRGKEQCSGKCRFECREQGHSQWGAMSTWG